MAMIKNLLFDFGGVIIPIEPMAFAREMTAMGCSDIAALHEHFLREEVYTRFEKGQMSPEEFRLMLRTGLDNHATDQQLDRAWNLILGEIPSHRVKFLEGLRSEYRIFLLSNTNKIHYDHYQEHFCKSYGYSSLDDLFEKAYYSFKIGLYKPDPAIFEYVLKDSALIPEETLFIDDYSTNIEAAKKLGFDVIHLSDGSEVGEAVISVLNPSV